MEDLVIAETGQAGSNAGSLTLIFATLVNILMKQELETTLTFRFKKEIRRMMP